MSIASLDIRRWSDTTSIGREVRLLADIAVGAFVDDVLELVSSHVRAEILPVLQDRSADGYMAARTRKEALKKWLSVEHPLDWGVDADTHILLTQVVSRDQVEAARSLPKSARGQLSVQDFVDILFHVGTTTGLRAVRPPLWNKGQCWPVLRAAVTEALVRTARALPAAEVNDFVKEAFVAIVEERRIRFFPDALPPNASRRLPSIEPSLRSWSKIGAEVRPRVAGHSAQLTQSQRLEFQMSQNSLQEMEQDLTTRWNVTNVVIGEYHKYIDRTSLPNGWKEADSLLLKDADDFVFECYRWAGYEFEHRRADWTCDLAFHLAFLLAKVAPTVAWPERSGEDIAPLLAELGIPSLKKAARGTVFVPVHLRRAAIDVIRKVPWTVRKGGKGTKDEIVYLKSAAYVFLLWMCPSSPLRQRVAKPPISLGDPWSKKHRKWHRPMRTAGFRNATPPQMLTGPLLLLHRT